MRTAILNIDQQRAVSLGLDITDLALIDWFTAFSSSGRMEFKTINGDVFWWVSYKKAAEDLPILGLKDRQVARRFKTLCEQGIFELETVMTAKGNKAFFRLKTGVYSALYENEKAMYAKSDMAQKNDEAMYAKSDMRMYAKSDMASTTKVVLDNTLGISIAPSPENPVLEAVHGSRFEGENSSKNKDEKQSDERFIDIVLNDKSLYWVKKHQVEEWQDLYPAVNVAEQLKIMKGWSIANATKRKTRRGVESFIHRWLADEQNKGSRRAPANNNWRYEGKTSNAGFAGVESGEIDL